MFRKTARTLIVLLCWILVWHFAAMRVGSDLILPSPVSVVKTLINLCGELDFWLTAFASLMRILAGFVSGAVLGTLIAAMMARFSVVEMFLSPLLRVIRATPVASFIILALLWIGRSNVPGFIATLMVVPVVTSGLLTAIRETDTELLEMARAYKFGKVKTLRLVYIPSVLPQWRAALLTATGLAWKSGIAAEVLCTPKKAIGSELYYSKIYLETPSLFAWTAVVIILSFIIESALKRILRGRRKSDD